MLLIVLSINPKLITQNVYFCVTIEMITMILEIKWKLWHFSMVTKPFSVQLVEAVFTVCCICLAIFFAVLSSVNYLMCSIWDASPLIFYSLKTLRHFFYFIKQKVSKVHNLQKLCQANLQVLQEAVHQIIQEAKAVYSVTRVDWLPFLSLIF